MQAITYRGVRSRTWRQVVSSLVIFFGFCLVWTIHMAFEYSEFGTVSLVTMVIAVAANIVTALLLAYRNGPLIGTRGSLTLDDERLTYTRGSTTRRWPWAELSRFDLVGPGISRVSVIRFRPRALDWKIGILLGELTATGWMARIEDLYDTPLDEIAATLNEYRKRALNDKGATASA